MNRTNAMANLYGTMFIAELLYGTLHMSTSWFSGKVVGHCTTILVRRTLEPSKGTRSSKKGLALLSSSEGHHSLFCV